MAPYPRPADGLPDGLEHLLLGLVVEDDVEEEDEDALEGVEEGEDHGEPLRAICEVDESEDPRKAEDAEQRE